MKKMLINYLRNNDFDENSITLACHGFDIFVNDALNFIVIITIGLFTNTVLEALLFYIFFAFLRCSTGGYHANTKIKCILTYASIYSVFTLLLKTQFFNFIMINLVLTLSSAILILILSPVQHVNNPLTFKEVQMNKKKSICKTISIFLLYLLFIFLNSQFYTVLSIALIYTAGLILIHINTKNYLEVFNYEH
ncbi:MAG: accessory gene regulator B family protein [Anaerorhabdus sp.]|uniref:accessory gene regulator B family protein n=1 Tax=Anaerorhabdus sp. TaxID=1872524 RepID=UPI002FCA58D6